MKKILPLVLALVIVFNGFAALGASDTTLIRECVASASFHSLLISYCSAAILPILIVNKILSEEGAFPPAGPGKRHKDTGSRPCAPALTGELVKIERPCAVSPGAFGAIGPVPEAPPVFSRINAGRTEGTTAILFLLLYCIVLSLSNLPAPGPARSRFPAVPARSSRVGAFLFAGKRGAA